MLKPRPELIPWQIITGICALICGCVAGLGFAPFNLRLLTVFGFAGLIWLSQKTRPKTALLTGLFFGIGFFGLTVHWMWPVSWWVGILLPVAMSGYTLAAGWGISLLRNTSMWGLWTPCWLISIEWLSCRFPLGGFGWNRLGYVSADTPLQGYLGYLGVSGTGFIVAAAATGLAWVATTWRIRNLIVFASCFALICLGGGLLTLIPIPRGTNQIKIGMIQGDVVGKSGIDVLGYARSVTNNHFAETVQYKAKVDARLEDDYDFLLWPENSTDLDPTIDQETNSLISQAEQLVEAPILVGAVMDGPGTGQRQTSALWWSEGRVKARHDKRNLVPFGEYTPFKDVLLPLIPMLKNVGNQSVPGTKPGVLNVELPNGKQLTIGDIICFELAWDKTVYDTVRFGGEVILVQSNNATWTGYWQPKQQFEITRVRAMELQRPIVVSTTASYSGLIDERGKVLDRSEEATAYSKTYIVSASNHLSLAVRIAPWLEAIVSLIGLVALLVAQITTFRDEPSNIMQRLLRRPNGPKNSVG